jgi:predicted RNase H-like nuclease (RuvC/YqgF family)
MAVRSGAGTGVVVSLVVFILTTFFLLVMTIVFYSGQTKALDAKGESDNLLAAYIKSGQRNNEVFKQLEDTAKSNNQSVTEHLYGRLQQIGQFVDGSGATTSEEMQQSFRQLGVGDNQTVRDALRRTNQAVDDRQGEIDRLKAQLQSWEAENGQLKAQLGEMRDARAAQETAIEAQLGQYRQSVESYRTELDDTVARMEQRVDRMSQQHESEVRAFQTEIAGAASTASRWA